MFRGLFRSVAAACGAGLACGFVIGGRGGRYGLAVALLTDHWAPPRPDPPPLSAAAVVAAGVVAALVAGGLAIAHALDIARV